MPGNSERSAAYQALNNNIKEKEGRRHSAGNEPPVTMVLIKPTHPP